MVVRGSRKRWLFFREQRATDVDLVEIGGGPALHGRRHHRDSCRSSARWHALVGATLERRQPHVLISLQVSTPLEVSVDDERLNRKNSKKLKGKNFRRHGDRQSFGFSPLETLVALLVA